LASTVHEPSFELLKVTVSPAWGVVAPHEVQLPEALQLAVLLEFQTQALARAGLCAATVATTAKPKAAVQRRRDRRRAAPARSASSARLLSPRALERGVSADGAPPITGKTRRTTPGVMETGIHQFTVGRRTPRLKQLFLIGFAEFSGDPG
jgi:hypothetical protein